MHLPYSILKCRRRCGYSCGLPIGCRVFAAIGPVATNAARLLLKVMLAEDDRDSAESGFKDYFSKPVDLEKPEE